MKFDPKHTLVAAASILLCSLGFGNAHAVGITAIPTQAHDTGVVAADDMTEITLSLKLRNQDELESFVASTTDRRSANFRKFLTPQQFAARYGQSAATVDSVRSFLAIHGIVVTKVFSNNLVIVAQGTNARLQSLFGAPIHAFVDGTLAYQQPVAPVTLPAALQSVVGAISGLSTKAVYKSHRTASPAATGAFGIESRALDGTMPRPSIDPTPASGVPGQYTAIDLARQYHIAPLYERGATGKGATLGILTFAIYAKNDVGAYWGATGVNPDTSRITNVKVGIGGEALGAIETTLDVEQAGSVAPDAKIIVYMAPNTDAGAVQLYAQAVTENKADTLSTSWGQSEVLYTKQQLAAFDAIFLQAAAQGVPIIAASGDAGAFDLNGAGYTYPYFSAVATVEFPASSPYVIAAGGTTLPVRVVSSQGATVANITEERPWSWDYLRPFLARTAGGQAEYYANDFPVGSGGGVSLNYPVPAYQAAIPGVKTSAPGQFLFCMNADGGCTPGTLYGQFAAGFSGRNVPDVSLNADPVSGYSVFYEQQWTTGEGGTSFVAPQLNGIVALIVSQNKGRVGSLHSQLYGAFKAQGYGTGSPFRSMSYGSNLYYTSGPFFNPAAGIGSLDVDNLARALAP